MKGAKGDCLFFDNGVMINKTKFDTEKNCQARIKVLLSIGACSQDTVAYKCKECKFWHLGKPRFKTLYGV